jgi:shikimate dehydrogenase
MKLSEFAAKIELKTNTKNLEEVNQEIEKFDMIINSTSIGLKNETSPISFERANQETIVYDIVYSPMNTDFIKKAKDKKLQVIYGYEMLLGQATRAFEIWHGMEAPYNAMKKALLGGF